MSARTALVLLLALSTLSLLVGCGSSTPSAQAPPTGAFTTSSLSGTYVVSFSGTDISAVNDGLTNSGSFFAVVGTLTATNGSLTGIIDLVDPSLALVAGGTTGGVNPVQPGLAVTGSYRISADGRGTGSISFPVNSQTEQFGIDFVLSSPSSGQITRFDSNGTGSGTFDLQGSVSQSGLGSYAFSLSGVDPDADAFGTVGAFTVGGTGTITTGIEDVNDGNNANGTTGIALNGSVTLGSSGAAGTAVLAGTGSPYGTQFDVWPIDGTHLKLIETDGVEYIAGDAFTQQTSIPAGQLVYSMSGLDAGNLLASGGFMSYDGSSVISNGFEAMNDLSLTSVAQSETVAGTLTTSGTSGRYQLSLSGFYNGEGGIVTSPLFAAYPSTSGILLLEIDGLGVTAGTAFEQSATTLGTAQGYGLNLTGENSDGEVDDIAEFVVNSSGTLSDGLIDENDNGIEVLPNQALGPNGVYSFAGTGYGSISYPQTETTLIGALDLAFFVANSSTVVFIETDAGAQTGVGSLQLQSASGASPALAHTQAHAAALKAVAASHRKRQK
ncbi:MAG TPA: hypothetical protein VK706_09795 [Candidatus Sulfotelmatobacter sp.]|jgi:hypothetical protein|nr:hypothetical protein [Candidatus Sulfotelmatobacter sp.]